MNVQLINLASLFRIANGLGTFELLLFSGNSSGKHTTAWANYVYLFMDGKWFVTDNGPLEAEESEEE